jgi:hypothetical protein
MVDTAYAWVLAPGSMSAALNLLRKVRGSLAPLCTSENNELAGDKVAGVGGDDVEEAGFAFGVAEGLNGGDVLFCDLHSVRISAVSSCCSSTRLRWSRSPGEA